MIVRRELGSARERWQWLLVKARPETFVPFLAVPLFLAAFSLLTHIHSNPDSPLTFPLFFGCACLLLGLSGIIGFTFKSLPLLAVFAFCDLVVRSWMATLYFMRFPLEVGWMSILGECGMLFWIFLRVCCKITRQRVARQVNEAYRLEKEATELSRV